MSYCKSRDIKYSALNDLTIGVQQVVLYQNGEFYLELGAGGTEGKYSIKNDTITLDYKRKPTDWPTQLLISEKYIITIPNGKHVNQIKIRRN